MHNPIEIRDPQRGQWLRLLGLATLVAGTLDALDGVVFFGLHGLNPIQVLQYIASGLLGAASFSGGLATAGLGALIHYAIAFVVAAIYLLAVRLLAVRSIPALRSRWVVAGLLYGAAVYLVMTYGVLPHSAVAPSPVTLAAFANGILGHALFVGLPITRILRKA